MGEGLETGQLEPLIVQARDDFYMGYLWSTVGKLSVILKLLSFKRLAGHSFVNPFFFLAWIKTFINFARLCSRQ